MRAEALVASGGDGLNMAGKAHAALADIVAKGESTISASVGHEQCVAQCQETTGECFKPTPGVILAAGRGGAAWGDRECQRWHESVPSCG